MSVEVRDDNTRKFGDELEEALRRAGEMIGLTAEGYAKQACPVDTGHLRNSITHEVEVEGEQVEVAIGTNVKYAPYVELGYARGSEGREPNRPKSKKKTHGHNPQPFLTPAAQDHATQYRAILERELEK